MKIALSGTGSPCKSPEIAAEIANKLKKHYGIDCVYKEDTQFETPAYRRAEIFLHYLLDPSIEAVWSIRGGEGSADLLPFIEKEKAKLKAIKPKPLFGFSDFTPILVYFSQNLGWPCFHSPGAAQVALSQVDESSIQSVIDYLKTGKSAFSLANLLPLNSSAKENKTIEAYLTGGCLTLLAISIQDLWEVNVKNKIIFIEDVNEPAYKVSRTLKYFERISFFESAKAIIFGDFSPTPEQTILEVLRCFAERQKIPVLKTEQFGHGRKNLTLPYHIKCQLSLKENRMVINPAF